MSPARSAILWNVLVPHVSEVVGALDVLPDPLVREVIDMSHLRSDTGWSNLRGDAARSLLAHTAGHTFSNSDSS